MDRPLVVITGASSGIGRSVAKAFAREGNPLLLISRHMEALPELAEAAAVYAQADVADYAEVERTRPSAWSTTPASPMRATSRRWTKRASAARSTPT